MRLALLALPLLLAAGQAYAMKCKPMHAGAFECVTAQGIKATAYTRPYGYMLVLPDGSYQLLGKDWKPMERGPRQGSAGVSVVAPLGDGAVIHRPGGKVAICNPVGGALVCSE